ncbi:hypothetical protein Mapa_005209 [Marchantia paleacea]|nr:hypothetical protein Mapa_005209 [Marchantia paleacea]
MLMQREVEWKVYSLILLTLSSQQIYNLSDGDPQLALQSSTLLRSNPLRWLWLEEGRSYLPIAGKYTKNRTEVLATVINPISVIPVSVEYLELEKNRT